MDEYNIQYNTALLAFMFILILIAIFFIVYNVNVPIPLDTENADIVIIGGGTSACIMAYRLSQRYPSKSIIILERGKDRRTDPIVYNIANGTTVGYTAPYSELLPTDFPNITASVAYLNGGGSSHNLALVVRGSPDFYNKQWREQLGLSYNDLVNEYFPLIEDYEPADSSNTSSLRFTSGKVKITQLPVSISIWPRIWPILVVFFNEGFGVLGQALEILNGHGPLRASDTFSNNITQTIAMMKNVPNTPDYNTDIVTCTANSPQIFIDNIIGIRQSTDVAYLPHSVITFDKNGNGRRGNLQFVPNAVVTKVSSDMIEWTRRGTAPPGGESYGLSTKTSGNVPVNSTTKVNKGGKVIMCAGAIYTPFLLQLSGFDNPNIGKDLTTHYGCTMILSIDATPDDSFIFSSGPIAFVSRNGTDNTRDWQFIVEGAFNQSLLDGIDYPKTPNTRLFSFILWNLKPRTRGTVTVNSDNMTPNGAQLHPVEGTLFPLPKVDLNLFADGSFDDNASDLSSLIDGMRWMYTLSQGLSEIYPTLVPIFPPVPVLQESNPVILTEYIKRGLSLTDHYCSTCILGNVVDPSNFLLKGTDNIHIVDASIFPSISDGNTNYPCMTMAEIGAKRIGDTM